jgi:PIN domain nuclease of toxin-antitoxin system
MRTTFEPPSLLLDTHIWIWLVQGDLTLASANRDAVRVAANAGNLRISAITLWEVALLAARGRLELGEETYFWLEDAVARSGIAVDQLTTRVAAESCDLPGQFHRDPADRIIVATARVTGATLMTRDRRILDYAAAGHLNTIAV